MSNQAVQVVTGAFGYSGKYIARRLLEKGVTVRTLTNSLGRKNPFGGRIEAFPFSFDEPRKLTAALEGAAVLYNTYWVRFGTRGVTFEDAVRNTATLFRAAKDAGVERIVHISITNPSEQSPFAYVRGKARVEKILKASGLSYAILRPAILFGKEDILVNNISWVLRRLPFFGVFGSGAYRLRPIYVDDLARLAVEQGERRENAVIDAVGPESFTYKELVRAVGEAIGKRRPMVPVPPAMARVVGWMIGVLMHDVFVTRDELRGLMAGLLYVDSPATGTTRLTDWAKAHGDTLGRRYASELARWRDQRGSV